MRRGALVLSTLALLACSSARTRQVGELMEATVVPSSDAVFNAVVYTNGQLASSPRSDSDWTRLEDHARQLDEAAATLKTLAPPDDPGRWLEQSEAMAAASRLTLAAAGRRSLEGILEGGGKIYDSCTSCHAVYASQN